MNPITDYDQTDNHYVKTTVAAAFADREIAHDAVHRLHDEGFRDTWVGITRADDQAEYGGARTTGETRVESENWFTRFFGEGDESLHDVLVRHGVAEADAQAAGSLPSHGAVLTVDGANHPELVAQIIAECGGQLITRGFGQTGYQTAGSYGASATPYDENVGADRTPLLADTPNLPGDDVGMTSSGNGYADYGKYRGGTEVGDDTRMTLREERLRIDKERVARGDVSIGKDVVTETQHIDVPLIREELFIERRPIRGDSASVASASPFGSDTEIIRVPLTEERLNVTKVPVTTEEIVIGKRQVEEVQSVSETTRKETLRVDETDRPVTAGRFPSEIDN